MLNLGIDAPVAEPLEACSDRHPVAYYSQVQIKPLSGFQPFTPRTRRGVICRRFPRDSIVAPGARMRVSVRFPLKPHLVGAAAVQK
jgi:hypothetical protein